MTNTETPAIGSTVTATFYRGAPLTGTLNGYSVEFPNTSYAWIRLANGNVVSALASRVVAS